MNPATAVLVVAALLVAGTLTLPEVLEWKERERRAHPLAPFSRTLLRASALALQWCGLLGLVRGQAVRIWADLDACLMRAPMVPDAPDWVTSWWQFAAGLFLGLITLRGLVSAALCGVVACAQLACLVLVRWRLPLGPGSGAELSALALAVLVPASVVAGAALWRVRRVAWQPGEREGCRRVTQAAGMAALVQIATAPIWLHERWPSGLMPGLLLLGITGIGLVVLLLAGYPALPKPPPVNGPPPAVAVFGTALLEQRRLAWLQLFCVLALVNLAVAGSATGQACRQGRRLLDRVAAQPELLCWRPDPSRAEWSQVAARLEQTAATYAHHRWCGQWLLVAAWIHATRLHSPYRAGLLLHQVKDEYPRCRAVPPLGWPAGRTAGAIAGDMLRLLGADGGPDAASAT